MTDERDRNDPPRNSRDLLTLAEAAAVLRTPPATLRYWRYLRTGPRSFKVGRHVVYDRNDVDDWLDAQRGDNPPPNQ